MIMSMRQTFQLPFACLSPEALCRRIETNRRHGRREYFVTLDVLGLDRATWDADYARALRGSSLIFLDGAGLVPAARLAGFSPPPRLPGADLFRYLCAQAALRGWRVFLYGARPGIAGELAGNLRRLPVPVTVCGVLDGFGERDEAVRTIRRCQPDLLFVALGVPAQECFLAEQMPALGLPFALGVGGSFDVVSGHLRRAPRLLQRLGLEWLFRLLQEPARIVRIRRIPLVFLRLLLARLRGGIPRVR